MKTPTEKHHVDAIDPDAANLRCYLPGLQKAVSDGAITPSEANKALGKVADAMSAARSQPARPTRSVRT